VYRPDWTEDKEKYTINGYMEGLCIEPLTNYSRIFSFKNLKTAEMFLEKYRSQLEDIKELL